MRLIDRFLNMMSTIGAAAVEAADLPEQSNAPITPALAVVKAKLESKKGELAGLYGSITTNVEAIKEAEGKIPALKDQIASFERAVNVLEEAAKATGTA